MIKVELSTLVLLCGICAAAASFAVNALLH